MKTARILLWMIPCILLVLPGAHGGTEGIRILYVNDFHGYAEPYAPLGSDNLAGGLSFLAHKVHQLREGPPSLLLAAGDMIQGSNWANLSQGAPVIEAMNEMRFDAMVVGNHEFDFGQESLRKRVSEAAFPVLGANVQGLEYLKPYTIATVGHMRAALIGVVTEETPVSTHPRNAAGLSFGPPAEALRNILEEIRGKVDLVVVLSHCGYAADRALAESVDGIDVIIGGHSHTRLLTPTMVNNTWIVQAWEHAKSLGVLDLTVESGRVIGAEGRLEDISPVEGGSDGAVLAIVGKHRQRLDAVLEEKIGEASADLDGVNVRRQETNLGNLVADIIRKTAGADAGLINGGTIRTSIRKGDIRVKDVYSVLPFESYPVAIRLTGKQMRDALEHGVSGIAEGAGRFPQVSGIRLSYRPEGALGPRIESLTVGGEPVDDGKVYSVATIDFLAAGGDGFRSFGDAIRSAGTSSQEAGRLTGDAIVFNDTSRWLRDILSDHIRETKQIAPSVEGRIREVR